MRQEIKTLGGKVTISIFGISIFLGLAITVLGSTNLLPLKMEYPVGYTSEALKIGENHYIIPIEFVSRVQIYDKNLQFQRSVWVTANGGKYTLYPADNKNFWVYAGKKRQRFKFNLSGEKLLSDNYEELPKVAPNTTELNLPISLIGWIFSDFWHLWLISMLSFFSTYLLEKKANKKTGKNQ